MAHIKSQQPKFNKSIFCSYILTLLSNILSFIPQWVFSTWIWPYQRARLRSEQEAGPTLQYVKTKVHCFLNLHFFKSILLDHCSVKKTEKKNDQNSISLQMHFNKLRICAFSDLNPIVKCMMNLCEVSVNSILDFVHLCIYCVTVNETIPAIVNTSHLSFPFHTVSFHCIDLNPVVHAIQ